MGGVPNNVINKVEYLVFLSKRTGVLQRLAGVVSHPVSHRETGTKKVPFTSRTLVGGRHSLEKDDWERFYRPGEKERHTDSVMQLKLRKKTMHLS
jgi:hypothetical protein